MSLNSQQFTPYTRMLMTVAVMTATLLQVLDTTIVNVALPHMQGELGANSSEISWVLTSYLVASAVFMPLTGYFTDRLGQKKYLLLSIGGFVFASALCGIAASLSQMVVFRLLQGVFGAALVPLSQAILTDIYPENERGKAMAIWGMGVMIGPILGPTLGGYLTDIATWRWNFYINVPIGLGCLCLTWAIMPSSSTRPRVMDWRGLVLISIAIGALQYVLDRGNQADWFDSRSICIAAFMTVMSFLGFLLHNVDRKNKPIVFDLSIFKDRNFSIACFIMAMFGLGTYGAMLIIPLMLENVFNYPVLTTGFMIAPRGISAMLSMMVVGKLMNKVDPRLFIFIGILICGAGMSMGTIYGADISFTWIILPMIVQGIGLGIVFVPISAIAFSTLPASSRTEAAGLFSLLRTMGGSIGISIVATLYSRHTQIAWNHLTGFVNSYHLAYKQYTQHFISSSAAHAALAHEMGKQAQLISFIDIYAFIAWSFVLMLPLVFLVKKQKNNTVDAVVFE